MDTRSINNEMYIALFHIALIFSIIGNYVGFKLTQYIWRKERAKLVKMFGEFDDY